MISEVYELEILKRIADTLDVPMSNLLVRKGETRTLEAQMAELIAAFVSIRDAAAREQCLDFIKGIAKIAARSND